MTSTARVSLLLRLRIWIHNRRANRKRGHRRRRRQAARVVERVRGIHGRSEGETFARRLAYLRRIDPLTFEELVLDAFERSPGHKAIRNRRYTGDGGIDGRVLLPGGAIVGVQCKRYTGPINWQHVEQFSVDLLASGMDSGVFVHTGRTPQGRGEQRRRPPGGVEILSGQRLLDFLLR